MKPKLAISNSGGRTSALMTKLCLDLYKDTHEIIVTFANTGLEHQATLDFIHRCDEHFGFDTVWLEAVVTHGSRIGIRHKIVTYETASRKGEPFEEYIKKYGIPNRSLPQCTSRLKTEVMESYLKTRGFLRGKSLNYDTAIGIRADEIDRCSVTRLENRFIYPLCDMDITKVDVLRFWSQQPFDLELPGEHYGNCVTCWKKSFRKLMTIAKESPESFDFMHRMESAYSNHKATKGPRLFFRGDKRVEDILRMAKEPFEAYSDIKGFIHGTFNPVLDTGSSCGESCEIGADDDKTL